MQNNYLLGFLYFLCLPCIHQVKVSLSRSGMARHFCLRANLQIHFLSGVEHSNMCSLKVYVLRSKKNRACYMVLSNYSEYVSRENNEFFETSSTNFYMQVALVIRERFICGFAYSLFAMCTKIQNMWPFPCFLTFLVNNNNTNNNENFF